MSAAVGLGRRTPGERPRGGLNARVARADYFFFLDVRPVGLLAFARLLAAALFCDFVEDFVASFLAAFFASFLDVSPPGLAAFARSLAAALFCAFVVDFAPSFFPAFLASFLVVVAEPISYPFRVHTPVDGGCGRVTRRQHHGNEYATRPPGRRAAGSSACSDAAAAPLSTQALRTVTIADVIPLDDPAVRDRRMLVLSVWASVAFPDRKWAL